MKKVLLYFMIFTVISCVSDDEYLPTETFISFNLDGEDYFLTEYQVMLNPLDENFRVIEMSFDEDTKKIKFSVLLEETNQIDEFEFIDNNTSYFSDVNFGNRETSITTHTDSKMEGTFRVTIEDEYTRPIFVISNGVINIEY